MNSNNKHTTLLLIPTLTLAILICCAGISTNAVYATGGLDDEEEEEAIEALQNDISEIKTSIGDLELNLQAGPNDIQANCPLTEEIVEEVIGNITEEITPLPLPPCPYAPEQNVTEPVVAEPEPEQNVTTCPFAQQPEPEPEENNVTEAIEEVIQNVTDTQTPCNIPEGIIPELVPQINETETETETEPAADVPICPFTGQPITAGSPAEEEPESEPTPAIPPLEDEQEVATIEFEASCGCFVIDKTPEEVQ